jgi:hypothetical protein
MAQRLAQRREPWETNVAPPCKPTFVGNDVYFTGTEHLRRIRNIVGSL